MPFATERQLNDLLRDWVEPLDVDIVVKGVGLDSRKVVDGELFVALQGEFNHGSRFALEAVEKGAVAIIHDASVDLTLDDALAASNDSDDESELQENAQLFSLPIIGITDLRAKLGALAVRMFGHEGKEEGELSVLGVTGTNGKTSVCGSYASLMTDLGSQCGFIGTLGWGVEGSLEETGLTTPDIFTVHRLCAQLQDRGCERLAIEVSSHALAQGRIDNLPVRTAIFTNISRDHLDYHGSIEEYRAEKAKLFQRSELKTAIINHDDPFAAEIMRGLPKGCASISFSVERDDADVRVLDLDVTPSGMTANIATPWGKAILQTQMLGQFNLQNMLAILAAACAEGAHIDRVIRGIAQLSSVQGRMQRVATDAGVEAIVDFAHTPDALEKALKATALHCKGQLWVVFGCGGDRDKGKRPMMAEVAERLADHLVVTSDNPRSEDPQVIIDEIVLDLKNRTSLKAIVDRQAAISWAISKARVGDCVLIAGKGHEQYQIIGEEKIPFDDVLVVREALAARALH